MKKLFFVLVTMALTAALFVGTTQAAPLFTDDFNSGASDQWGNEVGSWYVANGVYNAQFPSNNPTTYTSLPYNLRDFTIEVDFLNAGDGGIWLRSSYSDSPQTFNGVLLVVGGNYTGCDGMYFHTVENSSFSGGISQVDNIFTTGDNLHVKVIVSGNTYTAYLFRDGDEIGTTSFTDNLSRFYSGQVALYDFGPGLYTDSDLKFDNVSLTGSPVPLPGAIWLLGTGLLGLGAVGWRGRRKE